MKPATKTSPKIPNISIEKLRGIIDYDPESGVIKNKITRGEAKKGQISGSKHGAGYREMQINGNRLLAHRVAWAYFYGYWPTTTIDHINGIRDDNSIKNLREVTHQENLQNRQRAQKNNKSTGMLGVHFDKKLYRYVASIKINGKNIRLGIFECRFAAYKAYRDAKREYHKGCTI